MSSDEDGAALMAAFKKKGTSDVLEKHTTSSPRAQSTNNDSGGDRTIMRAKTPLQKQRAVCVRVPTAKINTADYTYYEPVDEVETIVREFAGKGKDLLFQVRLFGGRIKQVSGGTLQLRDDPRGRVKVAGAMGELIRLYKLCLLPVSFSTPRSLVETLLSPQRLI